MATANISKVEKVIVEDGVTLTLNRDEANYLYALIGSISSADFLRFNDDIYNALRKVGIATKFTIPVGTLVIPRGTTLNVRLTTG